LLELTSLIYHSYAVWFRYTRCSVFALPSWNVRSRDVHGILWAWDPMGRMGFPWEWEYEEPFEWEWDGNEN